MGKYFNYIKRNKEVIDIYKKINVYEEENNGYAHHDYQHACNVALLVKQLLTSLNYDQEFIDEAQVAAILHDVGCIKGKDGHPKRSYRFAKNYIEKNNMKLKYKDLVLEAIKNHSEGFDSDNIMQLVLILSDKLDIKKTRITQFGHTIIGNRQYQYINDIKIKIKNQKLKINFICDKNIDIEETENYYFTRKVFMAIKSFSKKLNLEPNVYINGQKWKNFYQK